MRRHLTAGLLALAAAATCPAAATAAEAPYAREWGLGLQLEDLRRVVRRARAGGRRQVLLGGYSVAASMAAAYAAWDFSGRPGYRDIDALLLLDEGAGV